MAGHGYFFFFARGLFLGFVLLGFVSQNVVLGWVKSRFWGVKIRFWGRCGVIIRFWGGFPDRDVIPVGSAIGLDSSDLAQLLQHVEALGYGGL